MSVLTLVRHGQASYMEADYDRLSPLGEEQARRLGHFWSRHRITFAQVFHGPARRHIRTMEIAGEIVRGAGLPWPEPGLVPDLDEFDAYTVQKQMLPVLVDKDENVRRLEGEFRQNQHSPEAGRLLQKLFEEVARHWSGGRFDMPEVETWAQFRHRVARAVNRIRAAAPASSNIAVFTSGGPIAATVAQVLDLPPEKAIEFVWLSRNCSYAQFLFSGDRFSMHAFNAIPHFDDLSMLTYR